MLDKTWLDYAVDVPYIEEKYNAKFIGKWSVRASNGSWTEPVHVFYEEKPPKGYTNYFAIYAQSGKPYIAEASSAFTQLTGVLANDGELLVSKHRHDYVESKDGSTFIDGGRDYIHTNANARLVEVEMVKGKLQIKRNA